MSTDNSTIMEKVWLNCSNDFQQRIPRPTQGQISDTVSALFNPMNRQYFNDFMQVLINRIAFTYVRGQRWENKLSVFKGQKINYGSTIQEIAPNWIRAHAYNVSDETLLKLNRPEAEVWYHSQNRQDRYDISISYDDLRTAFVDEYGLNNFIAKVMEVPINSDEYDEYRIMMQLIAEYDYNFGFYKEHVDAITDEDTAKAFLKKLREMAGLLEFPSARYNAANVDIPVFAKNSELVLLMTPSVKAAIDVDALSMLFNLEKGDVEQRIILVDEFPVPNVQAILTTEDFFVCHDTVYENTNFWNAQTLVNNYYLHHWGIYSVSPFVPAIMFTTDEGTSIPGVQQIFRNFDIVMYSSKTYLEDFENAQDNYQILDRNDTIAIITSDMWHDNEEYGLYTYFAALPQGNLLTTYPDGTTTQSGYGKIDEVVPESTTFEILSVNVDNMPTPFNSATRIDKYGKLHLQKSIHDMILNDIGKVDIEVQITSTYICPSTIPLDSNIVEHATKTFTITNRDSI